MKVKNEQVLKKAEMILSQNYTGSYTCPSKKLYPHQWSWDSAFIAMGNVFTDQNRAEKELLSLFKGQWSNGLVPHIVYHHPAERYFPDAEFWDTVDIPHGSKNVLTSGIVQPPLHATAALSIYQNAPDKRQARDFLFKIFNNLEDWHTYLHTERDPFQEGLVYIRHPWESGQDNSPIWDQVFRNWQIDEELIPSYRRIDTQIVNSAERPTKVDYDYYVYLVKFFRENRYDENQLRKQCPFLVQDVLFNSLLCQADRDLARIARIIGEDPAQFEEWAWQMEKAINKKLWNSVNSIYFDYDLVSQQSINIPVASGFAPLFAGIPAKEQAVQMVNYLDSSCFCRMGENCYALPSFDKCDPEFSPQKYWRGPIWMNINWLLYKGLKRYQYREYANWVRESITALPAKYGFYEYYEPNLGRGLGTKDFSWTAAILLEVLSEKMEMEKNQVGI